MKKLLVIGASDKQIPIIKRAKVMGHYVLCVDGNPKSVGFEFADEYEVIDVKDLDKCLDYAKRKNIDGVTTLSATVTLPAVNYIAEKMNLVGNPFNVSEKLKSKYQIKKILSDNGLNVLGEFYEIHSIDELNKIKDKLVYPVVVKPSDGSASKGVKIINDSLTLEEDVNFSLNNSRISSVYLEKYVQGKEYGAESFVYNGEVFVLGILKKNMTELPYKVELGHCVPSGLSIQQENIIKNEVKKAIKSLNILYGSVNMDIIFTKDNIPYIIDLGPRMGLNLIASHIIPYSTGFNVIDSTIKIALGEKININITQNKPVATRILNMKPGVVEKINSFEDLFKNKDLLDIVLKIKVGDKVNSYITNSDTCGWVVCKGNSIEEAILTAENTKKELDRLIIIRDK